jgi:hypothetical protein
LIAPLVRVKGSQSKRDGKNLKQGGYREEILFKWSELGKREKGLIGIDCIKRDRPGRGKTAQGQYLQGGLGEVPHPAGVASIRLMFGTGSVVTEGKF